MTLLLQKFQTPSHINRQSNNMRYSLVNINKNTGSVNLWALLTIPLNP